MSPVTAALCAAPPLPPWTPCSMYFFALSHAPPAVFKVIAKSTPVAVANIKNAATACNQILVFFSLSSKPSLASRPWPTEMDCTLIWVDRGVPERNSTVTNTAQRLKKCLRARERKMCETSVE